MERLICIAIGYVFGLFQTSYIYGKMHGIDIRKCGSGNAGTTNMLRTMGTKAGAITLLGDAFKCVIAVLVVRTLFRAQYEEILPLLSIYTAAGVILGHNFPFYMNFRGRKGNRSNGGPDYVDELADDADRNCHIWRNGSADTLCFSWLAAGVCQLFCGNHCLRTKRDVWHDTAISE